MQPIASYAEGLAQGRKESAAAVNELRLVRTMLKDRRLIGQNPRDDNNPDAAPETLLGRIDKALLPFD